MVDIMVTGRLTLFILRMPVVLEARGHQIINFFHLVMVLVSVKQFRKYESDYSKGHGAEICPGKAL